MLTGGGGANDPAVIRFAPAVMTFCLLDIKNLVRLAGLKMNNTLVFLYNNSVAIIPSYF